MQDYLIALGLLRAAHRHGIDARLWCESGMLVCDGAIDPQNYHPPVIVTPWNGRWHSGSGPKLRDQVRAATSSRLRSMRAAVIACDHIDREDKARDIRSLRATMPDEAVDWIDACWSIDDAGEISPIWLAGTGGNWASQDMGTTALKAALAVDAGRGDEQGEYHVTAYGHRDMTAMEYLLMMEGIIALSPSTTRRLSQDSTQPCRSEHCIAETVLSSEQTVGSWWLPMWPAPATYHELRAVLSNHCGWDDDVRAAVWIKTGHADRGITEYCRWAIIRSSGDIVRGVQP